MTDTEQPYVDPWPLFEEAYSKFPCLADIEAARKSTDGAHDN